jgi:4-diphosphocytidyl-2-C-methyl-D-erythritol kinase
VSRLTVAIPAKINLHLEVLGRRPDGYHELRTIFQSIDLWDRLTAEPAAEGTFELAVEPPGAVDAGEANTVRRAARELATAANRTPGVRLRLGKAIPVAAGLGGGSADAAAALILLDRLWRTGLDAAALDGLAARIGSDVPFFLHGGRALGTGRGTDIVELPDAEPSTVVIGVPQARLATAEIYRRHPSRLTCAEAAGTVGAPAAGRDGSPEPQATANDLEPTVVACCPEVADGLRALRRHGPRLAAVSGSGPAVFGLFGTRVAARLAAAGLPRGWFVHIGRTLGRNRARPRVGRSE